MPIFGSGKDRGLHIALALGLTVGCHEERERGADGVLVVAPEQQATWVKNFNPLLAPGSARWPTRAGIYEPLLIFNTLADEFVPWLATRYGWLEDNRALEMTLRSGVRWSDGRPFSSADVQTTFELLGRFPALDTNRVWRFLKGVEAKDTHRVLFRFREPYVPGLVDIAHQPIVPRHVWQGIDDPVTFANEHPVGTGPFTEIRAFRPQVYELGKNPHYWQKRDDGAEAIRVPAFSSTDQANLALITGELDWAANFVPAVDRVFVARDPAHNRYWFPLVAGTVVLYANTEAPPFDDVRLRKALSASIDRERLVKIAMYGYTRPADATGLSDAYASWRSAEIGRADWVAFDPARAKDALDGAGYALDDGVRVDRNGTPLRFSLNTVAAWPDWARAAEVVADNLRAVGIEVAVKATEFGVYFENLQRGAYQLSLGWTPEGPNPYHFYRGVMSRRMLRPKGELSPENWGRFSSDAVDALLTRFEQTSDASEQRALVDDMQRHFAEAAPVIPLFSAVSWGEYTTHRFDGFPSAERPYAKLAPYAAPECLLVLSEIERKDLEVSR